jgi:hypothetical protein
MNVAFSRVLPLSARVRAVRRRDRVLNLDTALRIPAHGAVDGPRLDSVPAPQMPQAHAFPAAHRAVRVGHRFALLSKTVAA